MQALQIAIGGSSFNPVEPKNNKILRLKDENSLQVARIDPTQYLQPLVRFVQPIARPFIRTISLISHCTYRILFAILDVFYRIIFNPEFDLNSDSFQNKLKGLNKDIPLLEMRILTLNDMFNQKYKLPNDIEELHRVLVDVKSVVELVQGYQKKIGKPEFVLPIHVQLNEMTKKFENIQGQLNHFCYTKFGSILREFKLNVEFFTQSDAPVPADICDQLQKMNEELQRIFDLILDNFQSSGQLENDKCKNHLTDLSDLIEEINLQIPHTDSQNENGHSEIDGVDKPLKLTYNRNSCYMHSAMQLLLCSDVVCKALVEDQLPLPGSKNLVLNTVLTPEEYHKQVEIRNELRQFVKGSKFKPPIKLTNLEYFFYLLGGPSSQRLREKIFDSGLHIDFIPRNMYQQLDTAAMTEFLIDNCLKKKFEFWAQKSYEREDLYPGLEFRGRIEPQTTLQIALFEEPGVKTQTLEKLIWRSCGLTKTLADPKNLILCNPKDPRTIVRDATTTAVNNPPQQVDHITEWMQFSGEPPKPGEVNVASEPPAMIIHLKRFCVTNQLTGATTKLEYPIEMPGDGILDLSNYYRLNKPGKVRYKIKGFTSHQGGLHGGHYISFVEKNGKFFCCNDMDSSFYREISEKEFYSYPQPYTILLEKIVE